VTAAGEGPVAILAGGGGLPMALVESLRRRGRSPRILAFRGFADRRLARLSDGIADTLDVESVLATLARWKPALVVLVGAVNRPAPLAVLSAFSAYRNRQHLAELMASGDDGLLSAVIRLLEERGFTVGRIDELAPELLAKQGVLGAVAPAPEAVAGISRGFSLLAALSPFDVGQAAAISGTRVIAVEGPEGTDAMLKRVKRIVGRGVKDRRGVLVKTAKSSQDLRIDLPAIGPRTVLRAAAAGLAGIAVGAGATLILDESRTIATADRLKLFLVGHGTNATTS
jgi:DUF1009 family protein